VTEKRHEGGQADPGVDQAGPESVPKLMKGDVERPPNGVGESGGGHRHVESLTQTVLAEAAAAFAEHEVSEVTVARVRQRPVMSALARPVVEQCDGFGIERDHSLGAELAGRNAQPGAVVAEVDDAVELEIEQLADTHSGGSQQPDANSGEAVLELADGAHHRPVDVG
jgi:hypothetical protein